ncbi:hypothetical protein PVAP13_9NG521200 [Panicum virgatum]|uniref:3-beta hydroxysteroid dehydrogenase/isomerase domain-containing protein n=1 Tax=Panicum virgatum TaxID=38727 RepID=A0A8T0MT19_PANVG|nr:hypothetical protein PVAP13_9NG521200 [Panicum virgatum]
MGEARNGSEATDRVVRAVTGGPGFMARHLVVALLRSGEWHVRVTDLAPNIVLGPGENEGLLGDALRDGRAVFVSVDVCNLDQVIKASERVDVVFHTAAANPGKNNLQLHYKVNVEGTKSVIDACKICKVKRLIHTSSSAVVFDGVHGLVDVNESLPYPDKFPNAYTKTKAEAEKLVMKANETDDLLTCCIHPSSIFGLGDMISFLKNFIYWTLGYFGWFYMNLLLKQNLSISMKIGPISKFVIGDGKNYDDFVYVENVVHAHICADRILSTVEGAKRSGGKAYFITNMEPMNMWDFLDMVQEELGYKRLFKIRIPVLIIKPISYLVEWGYKLLYRCGMFQPQILTPARIKYVTLNRTFSCNKAIEELGYKPTVTIMDGLKTTVKSYIQLKNKDFSK